MREHSRFASDWMRARSRDLEPLFSELAADGFIDYVAWPIEHTLAEKHFVTFASKGAGGVH